MYNLVTSDTSCFFWVADVWFVYPLNADSISYRHCESCMRGARVSSFALETCAMTHRLEPSAHEVMHGYTVPFGWRHTRAHPTCLQPRAASELTGRSADWKWVAPVPSIIEKANGRLPSAARDARIQLVTQHQTTAAVPRSTDRQRYGDSFSATGWRRRCEFHLRHWAKTEDLAAMLHTHCITSDDRWLHRW
jgi:hypothetical protein